MTNLARFSKLAVNLLMIAGTISCSSSKMTKEPGLKSSIAESEFPSLYTPKAAKAEAKDYDLSISFADSTVTLDCSNAPLSEILDAFIENSGVSFIRPLSSTNAFPSYLKTGTLRKR